MSLQHLFSCIEPELKILFHDQKSVSVTTTIFIPVTFASFSAKCISPYFQENFQTFMKQFFDDNPFSDEEQEYKSDLLDIKDDYVDDFKATYKEEDSIKSISYNGECSTEEKTDPIVLNIKRLGKTESSENDKSSKVKGSERQNNFICLECDFNTFELKELRYHYKETNHGKNYYEIIIVDDIKKYKCTQCAYTHERNEALRNHYKRNHLHNEKTGRFKCKKCDHVAFSKEALDLHFANHKRNPEAPVVCPTCNKQFKRKHHLKSHMQTHSKHDEAKLQTRESQVLGTEKSSSGHERLKF